MKKSDIEKIKRRNRGFLISALTVAVICVGIIVLLTLNPLRVPDETDCNKQTVTVQKSYYSIGGRYIASRTYIKTTDSVTYVLRGNYDKKVLNEVCTLGQRVDIEWYNDFFEGETIVNMSVDGTTVLEYERTPLWQNFLGALAIGTGSFLLLGVPQLLLYRFFKKNDIRKRENRDLRILKKYGDKARISDE